MITENQIAETDRLLDDLEQAARSEISNSDFFDQLLASLRVLVHSESSMILLRVKSTGWVLLAQNGPTQVALRDDLESKANTASVEKFLSGVVMNKSWLAVPIRPDRFNEGCLFVSFDGVVPHSGIKSLSTVVLAFAEVLAIRQTNRWEKLLESRWPSIHLLMEKLSDTTSVKEASMLIANQLVSEFSTSRVSVIAGYPGARARTLAISGVLTIDRRAREVLSIERVAAKVILEGKPILRQESTEASETPSISRNPISEDGTFNNLLAISNQLGSNKQMGSFSVLIMEWPDRSSMMDAVPAITCFLPSLNVAWRQQQRWLDVPRLGKVWKGLSPRFLSSFASYRTLQLLALVAVVGTASWLLNRPYAMVIEADAVLEPKSRRAIFSNVDGFVEKLLVEDGQLVRKGQLLAKLRSPVLNLQIEETIGQIKSISEKRNGLRVAVNQTTNTSPEAIVAQTRISADILLLETQEKQARDKLAFLTKEQADLQISSPIDGVVVSRDLRAELETRPLRRGDVLFSVADLEGDWQLNVRVADNDSGYLKKYYGGEHLDATFAFDSLPSEKFDTRVQHIADTIENPAGTPYLLVVAGIERDVAKRAYMGANARVRFTCGEESLWFVWCRPLVEALQKRGWLFTTPERQ